MVTLYNIRSKISFHSSNYGVILRATEERRGTWRKTVYDEKRAVFLAQPFASGWPDCFSVSAKHWFEDKLICLGFIKFAYPFLYPRKWYIDHLYVCTYIHRISTKSRSRANIVTVCLHYPRNTDQIILKRVSISMITMNFAVRENNILLVIWSFVLMFYCEVWKCDMLFHFIKKLKPIRFQSDIDSKTYMFIHSYYQDLFYVWVVCWQCYSFGTNFISICGYCDSPRIKMQSYKQ